MKKDPSDVVADLTGKLERHLPAYVTGTASWTANIPLGKFDRGELEASFRDVPLRVDRWRTWACDHQVELAYETRVVHFTRQTLVTHVVIPDIDTAARLSGRPWPAFLERERARAVVLRERFEHLDSPDLLEGALRAVRKLDDVNFDLVCRTAAWVAGAGDTSTLTPRQVPLEGVHAKWLQKHRAAVVLLSNRTGFELAPAHPSRVHLTYLDPVHRRNGGRRFDCVSVGDTVMLPYEPRVVVISENKDTAIHFPPTPDAVAIEGEGRAVSPVAALPWVLAAVTVAYWGDIDPDGFEILDQLRSKGLPVTSMLMDEATFELYERYGTDVDKDGRPLGPREPRPTLWLTPAERALYERLCSPDHRGHRRLEQERIPLAVAVGELHELTAQAG